MREGLRPEEHKSLHEHVQSVRVVILVLFHTVRRFRHVAQNLENFILACLLRFKN